MSAARKPVSPPDMSGLVPGNPLLSRFGNDVPGPAAPAVPAPRKKAAGPEMDRRSWYMPRSIADALTEEIDELHFSTRKPKWRILSAIVVVAMRHQDEVRAHLLGDQDGGLGDR